MRIENNHAHADTVYGATSFKNYTLIVKNIFEAKFYETKSLTVHLPYEIQHPNHFPQINKGYRFITFTEILKKIFCLKLYWENAPDLEDKKWSLRYGQTSWDYVPYSIELCLDIGHLILGAKNYKEAKERIREIIATRGKQIKHIHVHENNLFSDQHLKPLKLKQLIKKIIKERSYIYEKQN